MLLHSLWKQMKKCLGMKFRKAQHNEHFISNKGKQAWPQLRALQLKDQGTLLIHRSKSIQAHWTNTLITRQLNRQQHSYSSLTYFAEPKDGTRRSTELGTVMENSHVTTFEMHLPFDVSLKAVQILVGYRALNARGTRTETGQVQHLQHSRITYSKAAEEQLAMVSCLCTQQPVNHKGLQNIGNFWPNRSCGAQSNSWANSTSLWPSASCTSVPQSFSHKVGIKSAPMFPYHLPYLFSL